MPTLIERLRSGTDGSHLWWAKLHVEAADEIERLTAERDALREALGKCRPWFAPDTFVGQGLISMVDAALEETQ